jgi:N-acylglucosamine-6-phosphate 2-epimerase
VEGGGVSDPFEALRGGLVVSVQAPEGSPMGAATHMAAMARAAEAGGAAGIRAQEMAAIKAAVSLPVIGLRKRRVKGSEVYITPELEDARAVAAAGADLVAVDATLRPRPGGLSAERFLRELAAELDVPVLADVDSLEAGAAAREAGAAAVATTLAGYTTAAAHRKAPSVEFVGHTPTNSTVAGGLAPAAGPDLDLVAALAAELDCPVLAEGRIATPDQARAAFEAGAFAVVVGTAITDPVALTRSFAAASPRSLHAAR